MEITQKPIVLTGRSNNVAARFESKLSTSIQWKKKTRRNKRVLFQRKAEDEAINNHCERVSQESTNRDFSFNILMCYWPILTIFVKCRVYSQLTLLQYVKIVRYCGWINQGLQCSTLCWMKTIFLALIKIFCNNYKKSTVIFSSRGLWCNKFYFTTYTLSTQPPSPLLLPSSKNNR